MNLSPTATALLTHLSAKCRGRENPIPAPTLARRVGVSVRILQDVVGELIEAGHLVGSSCTPGRHGFFLMQDEADLTEGTAHIRARALGCLHRVALLRKAAEKRFGPKALTLFDLEDASRAS